MVKLWIINHINYNNILNKKSELINKCRQFKQVLIKACKEEAVNLSFMHVCKNYVFVYFRRKRYYMPDDWELHGYLSFILSVLKIYICSLH